ncbi:methyltransferase domain-containing protein [uncultured Desulfovibrio sp.]|uniref:class I SAM-dependent methyltransferase n=1 Tax=uncultured Desulfovibrio sp. TaxID=167968 RepID=UPI00320B7302
MHTLQLDSERERWMWHCCVAALQASIASWKRRNTHLLEINCGAGACLQVLWECGFDVTGTGADPELRRLAVQTAPCGTEVLAGVDDDLPVETDAFDWVILHLGDHTAEQTRSAVREAARIASRGLVVTFWNRSSLLRLLPVMLRRRFPIPCRGQFLWQVFAAVQGLSGRKWISGCLPFASLQRHLGPMGVFGRLCSAIVGVWAMVRIDFDAAARGTPLGVRVGAAGSLAREAAVMECRADAQEQQKDALYVPEGNSAESQAQDRARAARACPGLQRLGRLEVLPVPSKQSVRL